MNPKTYLEFIFFVCLGVGFMPSCQEGSIGHWPDAAGLTEADLVRDEEIIADNLEDKSPTEEMTVTENPTDETPVGENIITEAYYVSTSGNDDNPGTFLKPWRTIQNAANSMIGGDTVFIRGGTYNERVALEYKDNSDGPTITFAAYQGEEVILDGTGIDIQYGGGLFHVWETDYIRVSGLKVQNSNGAGIYIAYSQHIVVDHNQTYDTVKSGISTWGSTDVMVDGNDIELACNAHPNYSASEENISIDSSANVEVKNNLVHKASNIPDGYSGGEGINVKNGSSNVKVHRNIVHLDERPDGKPSNRLAFGLDAWNNTANTHDIEYYSNIAYNSSYGFIVSSEQGGTVENVKLYNNVAYNNNRGAGFSIVWWSGTVDGIKKNIQFINNTSYHNGVGFSIQSPSNEGVIVRNNIFSQNGTSIAIRAEAVPQTTVDHNLFDGPGDPMGSDVVDGNPLFFDTAQGDFHLTKDSPAVDAGSDLNAPANDFDGTSRPQPQGGIFDLGAFEYIPPTIR